MTWLSALNALRRVPAAVWVVLVIVGLAAGAVVYADRREDAAYARGKRDAADGAVFDSAMVERAARRVAAQIARTETVTVQVERSQRAAREAIAAVPDSLRQLPPVQLLITATERLLRDVDSLKSAHLEERAAWTERARVDSATNYALRVMNTAQRDTIVALRRRPTWKHVIGSAAAGALVVATAGLVR